MTPFWLGFLCGVVLIPTLFVVLIGCGVLWWTLPARRS